MIYGKDLIGYIMCYPRATKMPPDPTEGRNTNILYYIKK